MEKVVQNKSPAQKLSQAVDDDEWPNEAAMCVVAYPGL